MVPHSGQNSIGVPYACSRNKGVWLGYGDTVEFFSEITIMLCPAGSGIDGSLLAIHYREDVRITHAPHRSAHTQQPDRDAAS